MKNILVVIEELGTLLKQYKDEIKFKEYEIERLRSQLEKLEKYEK